MNRTGQFCRPCSAYQSTVSSECHFSLDFRNACSVISPVKQRPISEHTLEIAGTNKRCMSAFWLSLGLSSQKLIAIRNRFCRLLLCREENYLLGPLVPKRLNCGVAFQNGIGSIVPIDNTDNDMGPSSSIHPLKSADLQPIQSWHILKSNSCMMVIQ